PIGFVAAWWWLASLAVIRYTAGLKTQGIFQIAWVNASAALAAPSLMLAAWMLGGLATASLPVVRALPPVLRGSGLVALLLTLSVGLGADAHRVAFGDEAPQRTPRFNSCRALKAAAYYVRSHGDANTYVFHLSSDTFLGHFGEYYYGLSYARSARPEDPNHILDFGLDTLGRRYPPEAFYPAYGVKQFDYYVDFVDERDPFKTTALDRLERAGARVVGVITVKENPKAAGHIVGRILSFRDEPLTELEYHAAAAEWDRRFAKRRTLFQQPLAGTSYHFGYNWRRPE
ncbi:MAG: hypothetical protein HY216_09555, partial [Candidatus Rokubacteria bacterium]|nr:hypothetical protein [Candidatus Rokubacteria bacterium]